MPGEGCQIVNGTTKEERKTSLEDWNTTSPCDKDVKVRGHLEKGYSSILKKEEGNNTRGEKDFILRRKN